MLGVLGRPVLVQNLEVVDVLRVPIVKPGRYVLQWRWDAERSDQIWSNCADINIVYAGGLGGKRVAAEFYLSNFSRH